MAQFKNWHCNNCHDEVQGEYNVCPSCKTPRYPGLKSVETEKPTEEQPEMVFSQQTPPVPWAKTAVRFEGTDAITFLMCQKNAAETQTDGNYALRPIPGGWEWYSPVAPAVFEI